MMTTLVGRLHVGQDGLGCEELALQVHGDPVVPVFRGDLRSRVALVVGSVVDKDLNRAEGVPDPADGGAQGSDVGQIGMFEVDVETLARQLADYGLRRVMGDVNEGDFGFLLGEAADNRLADTRTSTGNEHHLVFQVGIYRSHLFLPLPDGFRQPTVLGESFLHSSAVGKGSILEHPTELLIQRSPPGAKL
jgi:hypothetical protein